MPKREEQKQKTIEVYKAHVRRNLTSSAISLNDYLNTAAIIYSTVKKKSDLKGTELLASA